MSENPTHTRVYASLKHGEVVCAAHFTSSDRILVTGGRGSVKLWDCSPYQVGAPLQQTPLFSLPCLDNAYVVFSLSHV